MLSTKTVLIVVLLMIVMVTLSACPVKKDVSRVASASYVVQGTLTPFEPTSTPGTPQPTRTPTPKITILPYHTFTPTRTPTRIGTATPNPDCRRLIYCTPTPISTTK